MKNWWNARSSKQQTWIAIGVIVLVIAAVAGGGSDSKKDDDSNQAAATTSAATTATQTTTTKPEPLDTGRLSGGEAGQLQDTTNNFTAEVNAFENQIGGKCAGLAKVGEFAEMSKCFKESFEGVEGQAAVTDDDVLELIHASAKGCKDNLRALRHRVDDLFQAMRVLFRLGENISTDGEVNTLMAKGEQTASRRYRLTAAKARSKCAPE